MRRCDAVTGSCNDYPIRARHQSLRLAPRVDLFKRIRSYHKKQFCSRLEIAIESLDRLERVWPVGRFQLNRRNHRLWLVERCQHRHRVAMVSIGDPLRSLVRRPVRGDQQQSIQTELAHNRPRYLNVSVVNRIECSSECCDAILIHSFWVSSFWFLVSRCWFAVCFPNQKPETRNQKTATWFSIRSCSTFAPSAVTSASIPWPVTADISYISSPRPAQNSRRFSTLTASSTASIFEAATI